MTPPPPPPPPHTHTDGMLALALFAVFLYVLLPERKTLFRIFLLPRYSELYFPATTSGNTAPCEGVCSV